MLDEYALRFYVLLEQSLKLDAIDWKEAALAASIPYMEDNNRQEIMQSYEKQSHDIIEEIREANNTDTGNLEGLLSGQ